MAGQGSSSVKTIELTGKRWKVQLLWGYSLFFVGDFLVFSGLYAPPTSSSANGPLIGGLTLAIPGLAAIVHAKVMIWWHHR